MKTAQLPRAPRDLENVLVRVPSAMRQQLAQAAVEAKISQNQLINGYLFTVLFVQQFEPKCGSPEDLERLFFAMETALAREDGLAFGAFHVDDWSALSACVQNFVANDLITAPQTRTDPKMETTVAYTFSLTKVGRLQLPLLIRMLRSSISRGSQMRFESYQSMPV